MEAATVMERFPRWYRNHREQSNSLVFEPCNLIDLKGVPSLAIERQQQSCGITVSRMVIWLGIFVFAVTASGTLANGSWPQKFSAAKVRVISGFEWFGE